MNQEKVEIPAAASEVESGGSQHSEQSPERISDVHHLIRDFRQTRDRTERLVRDLNPEDCVVQLAEFASPPKWHLAHTSWFFEEVILKRLAHNYQEFDPAFPYLFNSYYNALGTRIGRAHRGALSRPALEQVMDYRNAVTEAMLQLLDRKPDHRELLILAELGIHHEQQHQELLLTDLKYAFHLNPLLPVYREDFDLCRHINREEGFVSLEEGVYTIGASGQSFHYDNELGRHKVYLHKAEVRKDLVTNGEYLEFINDNGYRNPQFWLDDGWSWLRESGTDKPLYWHQKDGRWMRYSLAGLKPLDDKEIVCHISYYEADAFARWKGMRLLTEFEWEALADMLSWGHRWEWTASAYLPYPGFTPMQGAASEYNGKFMVNQMVLRGASAATSPGHSRKTYRNFFYPQSQWQCTGIRLAARQ